MPCDPELLKEVPFFSLLDKDELAVLSEQVEVKRFAINERIYKIGSPPGRAYVVIVGKVRVSTIDEDFQEVTLDEPEIGQLFGFASMLDQLPHQSMATAVLDSVCIEVDRHDIATLIHKKPMAGMDLLSMLGRQFHAAEKLIQRRSMRNPNTLIDEKETFGERIADIVARFGGSWAFIGTFTSGIIIYSVISLALGTSSWDPYPFILLNLFLSMLAAIQAPVIMMSQNRQDKKDRLRSELDYAVNCRAEEEIRGLAKRLDHIEDYVEDLTKKKRLGATLETSS